MHVQGVLTEALFRMAGDHPYHCMYPLIALSNGDTEEGEPAAKNAHIRHTTNTARVSGVWLQAHCFPDHSVGCLVDSSMN
jgi:hypothetical protein